MVLGKTGCGKSTFLLSLFGELPFTKGSVRPYGRKAFVDQEPKILTGSI